MELRQLKTFQTVAKLLNFNRAAEILNYSQSAVSAQIKLLEEELRVPLFDRLGKSVRLTEAGHLLVQYSQKMLDIEKETLAKVSGGEEPQGSISIRIPQSIATYLLPSVLSEFHSRFPKVGLDISSCAYHSLSQELKTGLIDAAFLLADSIPFAELKAEVLSIVPIVIVASPNHPLAKQAAIHLGDLTGQAIFLPKHDCSYKMIFEQILTEEKVDSATIIELNSIEAIKQCVIKGIGMTMIPRMSVVHEISQNKLTILRWSEENLETAILMIWHKDKWLSPTLQAFMDTVREVFKSPDS
ncbi:MAG: LysR family transcriptional regulator [Syntrophales bacterium]|nr:LysR family transcriptional regulator [Syntrophales bacterium]MDD5641501.1 LysR family transcriptional regulator [Syntrophales bacterium]